MSGEVRLMKKDSLNYNQLSEHIIMGKVMKPEVVDCSTAQGSNENSFLRIPGEKSFDKKIGTKCSCGVHCKWIDKWMYQATRSNSLVSLPSTKRVDSKVMVQIDKDIPRT